MQCNGQCYFKYLQGEEKLAIGANAAKIIRGPNRSSEHCRFRIYPSSSVDDMIGGNVILFALNKNFNADTKLPVCTMQKVIIIKCFALAVQYLTCKVIL